MFVAEQITQASHDPGLGHDSETPGSKVDVLVLASQVEIDVGDLAAVAARLGDRGLTEHARREFHL